ncbi:hypothetical protein U0070_022825, partial [Myodes glareolus]
SELAYHTGCARGRNEEDTRHRLCYKGQENNNKSRCMRGQVGRQQQQAPAGRACKPASDLAPVPTQQPGPGMIKVTQTFNIHGTLQLSKFCQPYSEDRQQWVIRETSVWCLSGTLRFVFCVGSSESELGILDLIQVFVETLDKYFEKVCELDSIPHVDERLLKTQGSSDCNRKTVLPPEDHPYIQVRLKLMAAEGQSNIYKLLLCSFTF